MMFIDIWLPLLVLIPFVGYSSFPYWLPFLSFRAFQWCTHGANILTAALVLCTATYGIGSSLVGLYLNVMAMQQQHEEEQNCKDPVRTQSNNITDDDEGEDDDDDEEQATRPKKRRAIEGHIVVVLMYKETPESLSETAKAIARQTVIDGQNTPVYLVLGQEAAGGEQQNQARQDIFYQILGNKVADFCVYQHPKGLKDKHGRAELAGTGSNLRWAMQQFAAQHPSIDSNTFIVSKVDSGILLHPRYLEELELRCQNYFKDSPDLFDKEPILFQPHIHYQRDFDKAHPFIQVVSHLRVGALLSILIPWNLNGLTCYSIPYSNMKQVGFQQGHILGEDICSLVTQAALKKRLTKVVTLGMPVNNTLPLTIGDYIQQEKRWVVAYPGVLKWYWSQDPSWRSLYYIFKLIIWRYIFPVAVPLYLFGAGIMIPVLDAMGLLRAELSQTHYDIIRWSSLGLGVSTTAITLALPMISSILRLPFGKSNFFPQSRLPWWYQHLYLTLIWTIPSFLVFSILQFFFVVQSFVWCGTTKVVFRHENDKTDDNDEEDQQDEKCEPECASLH